MPQQTLNLYIKGNVIGVGFRAFVAKLANNMGLRGWVRNVYSKPEIFGTRGGVEVVVQGDKEGLELFQQRLKKTAPGKIEEIILQKVKKPENYNCFEIIY